MQSASNCQVGLPWTNPDNLKSPEVGPIVNYITMYKWIWLNRGDGSAKVTLKVNRNSTFLDEAPADVMG